MKFRDSREAGKDCLGVLAIEPSVTDTYKKYIQELKRPREGFEIPGRTRAQDLEPRETQVCDYIQKSNVRVG